MSGNATPEKKPMRGCLALLTVASVALAQGGPAPETVPPTATIASGVPLRVALERGVAIKRVGEPIQGRLVDPIYVFDRMVLPAGSLVEGHIAEIGGVSVNRRLTALLSGNLTPPREVRAEFDALVLNDGSRLSIRTSLARGTAHNVRVAARREKQRGLESKPQGSRAGAEHQDQASTRAFTAPGSMSQLKSSLLGMLPYQRHAWPAGALFTPVLLEALTAPSLTQMEARADSTAFAGPEDQELFARLLTPISSETAKRGAPVEAIVTRPLFSSNGGLLIPEGSHLLGDVVTAEPAHYFHRGGELFFVFRQVNLPAGTLLKGLQGHVEGVEADFDAHLALDSEGATRVSSPKTRFIFPALAVAASALSFHQDYNAKGIPDQDIGGRAESGAVGLGLIGTVVAQASRTLASSIAITGAAYSVYSTFIARGADVALPVNTPVKVRLTARAGKAGGGEPVQSSLR